jgi:hypothetical protein
MKNLSMLLSLLVIFAVQVEAAPSKAEAEVADAFGEYFQARKAQDYKTVVALESKFGTLNTNSDGSFHKPINKQSEASWQASGLGGNLSAYHPDFTELSDDVVHVRFYYEGVLQVAEISRDYRTRATMNWVKESGKWVAKTMHFSAASFGDVTVTQASDFED